MSTIAFQLGEQGSKLKEFETKLATYKKSRQRVESDATASIGDLLTATGIKTGLSIAKAIPVAGSIAEQIDDQSATEQLIQFRKYLRTRFKKEADIELLLSPIEILSRAFTGDLNRVLKTNQLVLTFDTFERTTQALEPWILALVSGKYGKIIANVIIVISGQNGLSANQWTEFRPVIKDYRLEPFSEQEARNFLIRMGVSDTQVADLIISASGRIPMWLTTLADRRPKTPRAIADVTADAVDRFLKWEEDPTKRTIACAASIPRRINDDILSVIATSTGTSETSFEWVYKLPFVTKGTEYWRYHDAVRAPMLRLARMNSPKKWREINEKLAVHFTEEQKILGVSVSSQSSDSKHQALKIEEYFHRLCAAPGQSLSQALEHAAEALNEGVHLAHHWCRMIIDAGDASGSQKLRDWGHRLLDTLLNPRTAAVSYLSTIVNGGNLTRRQLASTLTFRGIAFHQCGEFSRSLRDLDRALALDPLNAKALRTKGEISRKVGKIEEALNSLNEAIRLEPGDHDAWGERGIAYMAANEFSKAVDDFDRSLEIEPDNVLMLPLRGFCLYIIGRLDEALEDLNHSIDLFEQNVPAYGVRGLVFQQQGRLEDALTDFDRILEFSPESVWILIRRATLYYELGRFQDAVDGFNQASMLDSRDPWIFEGRGKALRALGRINEALEDLNYAIEQYDTDHSEALVGRALVYEELGRYDDALSDYDRAISSLPDKFSTLINRAICLYKTSQFEDALVDLNHAMELNSRNIGCLELRGSVYQLLGNPQGALHDFDQAIELGADDVWIFRDRAKILLEVGQYARALADIDRAIDLGMDDASVRDIRSSVYESSGDYELALAELEVCCLVEPSNYWFWYRKGRILLTQSNQEDARAAFREAERIARIQYLNGSHGSSESMDLVVVLIAAKKCDEAIELFRGKFPGDLTTWEIDRLKSRLNDLSSFMGIDREVADGLLRDISNKQIQTD